MIKILCDRCEKEIQEHGEDIGYISLGINVNPLQGIRENEISIQGAEFSNWHFCPECMKEIKDYIYSRPNAARLSKILNETESNNPESVSEPEKVEQKGRKRIDIGKIIALKNAGWSNVKIADEMGMTANNVAQYIYQYKKKQSEGA